MEVHCSEDIPGCSGADDGREVVFRSKVRDHLRGTVGPFVDEQNYPAMKGLPAQALGEKVYGLVSECEAASVKISDALVCGIGTRGSCSGLYPLRRRLGVRLCPIGSCPGQK